uniref:DUF5009 domain-containing protein n=1 Tax=Plectus sambesii TaxID=2011161 RepID=A0A914VNC1_9BILA
MNRRCVSASAANPSFTIDSALLYAHIDTTYNSSDFVLLEQSTECHNCPLVKVCSLRHSTTKLLVDTTFKSVIAVNNSQGGIINCSPWPVHFGEYGHYNLTINDTSCTISEVRPPVNSHTPIYWAFLAYLTLALVYGTALICFNRFRRVFTNPRITESDSDRLLVDLAAPVPRKRRLGFLDTFRGICIVIMIFVNYGGGHYWFFKHSSWNGLTLADLVFPWFMFVMGVSMALSFEKAAMSASFSKYRVLVSVVRRSAILFLLGMFVINSNGNKNSWANLRIMGVLQRFAIAYLFVACLRLFSLKTASHIRGMQNNMSSLAGPFVDVLVYWTDYLIVGVLLLIWCLIVFLLPVPGCPSGYLGPGGLDDGGQFANCTGGAAGYIDRLLLGDSHVHRRPSCYHLYRTTQRFDPEGILGCITSIFTVFLGLQAGQIFLIFESKKMQMKRLWYWAVIYGVGGGILCKFSQNDGFLPVNKNLWTPSFALVLSSLALLIISVLYYTIDDKEWWCGEPFYFVGMNSILLYVGHEVFEKCLPVQWEVPMNHSAQLFMSLWGASFWTVIAYAFHLNKFYLSL